MVNFPSKLPFASLLQYSPRGQSDLSRKSRDVRSAIKGDGVIGAYRVIDHAALRTKDILSAYGFLSDRFGSDVVLVPGPRSSVQKGEALWPAKRICDALVYYGLGLETLPCLVRKTSVSKAAFARPEPIDHYDSVECSGRIDAPSRITLVDDIVTRGSSFIGLYPRLKAAFPNAKIECFAVVRTMSDGDVENILAPVEGTITYNSGHLYRSP